MRFTLSLACASVALLASGCAAHRVSIATTVPAPVVVSDTVREELPNDYLRVSFLPAGVEATTLSRPGALRAAVRFGPLDVGIDPRQESLAMRCDGLFDAANVDQVVSDAQNQDRTSSMSRRISRIEASRPMNIASPIRK